VGECQETLSDPWRSDVGKRFMTLITRICSSPKSWSVQWPKWFTMRRRRNELGQRDVCNDKRRRFMTILKGLSSEICLAESGINR
jgi:hypothetical protein